MDFTHVTEAARECYEAPQGELIDLPEGVDVLASFSLTLTFDEWEAGDDLDFV